jgi:hypothetical protein
VRRLLLRDRLYGIKGGPFMSQGSEERRKLLQLLVSNSSWKHGRLAVELHAPFDSILSQAAKARAADAADLVAGSRSALLKTGGEGEI